MSLLIYCCFRGRYVLKTSPKARRRKDVILIEKKKTPMSMLFCWDVTTNLSALNNIQRNIIQQNWIYNPIYSNILYIVELYVCFATHFQHDILQKPFLRWGCRKKALPRGPER